jgi:hypothetical protein
MKIPNIIKMAVFWVAAPCDLVKFTNISEVLAASIIRAMMMMEAASTSETSNFYQTAWRNNPENSHLHTCHRTSRLSEGSVVPTDRAVSSHKVTHPESFQLIVCNAGNISHGILKPLQLLMH